MQLLCPECGQPIKAEHINVQEMVAVCSACDNIFKFIPSESKPKRRKVWQPQNLTLRDDDNLHMSFRTNFRLDKNEAFHASLVGSVALTFMTWIVTIERIVEKIPQLVFIFAFMAIVFYYWLALTVYNKTHIEMDDESIKVYRNPLPSPFNIQRDINLSGIESITCEETTISKKEEYDTPRYHVWANRIDGGRTVIVTDVTEEYGVFIAQRLNEYLHADETEMDVSRLTDMMESGYLEQELTITEDASQNHKYVDR